MTSPRLSDHPDSQQLRVLFEGKHLNASQAARVAGVKRPVIATWASRHKGKGFPQALPQDGETRETFYDALEFVEWASSRPTRNRSLDEMLVSAAIEASTGLEVQNFQDSMCSLLTLVLAYRVVDPKTDDRPTSLLRRYAQASPSTAQNITQLLLKVSAADIQNLSCLAFALARFSTDILGDTQTFAASVLSRRGSSEQVSLDLCSLVKDAGDKFRGKVRLHLARGADSAVTVQVAQSLLLNRDNQRELAITAQDQQSSSFARALTLVADEELLALPENQVDPSAIFFLLPLSKTALDAQEQWQELEALLLDAPVGVPILVLGRAEVLGSEFDPKKNKAREAVLSGGYLLALLETGTRQLVTESGARLMVAVFENRRIAHRQPLIALTSLSQRLDAAHRADREVTLHDIESVLNESRHDAVHSIQGEHQLARGVRVNWKELRENGFDALLASESRSVHDDEAKNRIEHNVQALTNAEYEPFSLRWSVEPRKGMTTTTLRSARDDGKLRRLPGVSAQKLEGIIEFSSAIDRVRVVDAASMEHLHLQGALPGVFASASTYDVLVERNLEMARPGDLLVLEGTRPAVLPVRADAGLMIAQAPVFVLRRNAVQIEVPEFRLEAFAGLVQAALDAQVEDGAAKASWGKARIAVSLLDAVLSAVPNAQVDALDEQLRRLRVQQEFLRKQLRSAQAVEADTLRGLAAGFLTFDGE